MLRLMQTALSDRRTTQDSFPADLAVMIGFCGLMGMRSAEACSVAIADVDYSRWKITVRGKGKKYRTIPVPVTLQQMLLDAAKHVGYRDVIWPGSLRSFWSAVARVGRKHGMVVSSHQLRATAATALWEATHDVHMLREFLGHENIETATHYVGIDEDDLRRALNGEEGDDDQREDPSGEEA